MSPLSDVSAQLCLYGAAVLLAGFIGLRWFEDVSVFIPSKTMTAHPGTRGLQYEDLKLKAADGPEIHGWFIPGPADAPVLLYCHGNGGNISNRIDKIKLMVEAGASVLAFDYRGYGKSGGSPSERGTYADAEAAWSWLTEVKKIAPEKIVPHGESLGCGVAVELALRHKPGGLIFESGFTSTVAVGKLIFPFLPVQWMVRYQYDNLAKVPRLSCPVLIMHSPQDDIIPFAMGRRIFEAAPGRKTFFEMKGDHNEGFLTTGGAYVETIRRFLRGL